MIDNTGSLVLTTQKLQKVAGGIYIFHGYWKIQKVLRFLEDQVQRMLSERKFSLFAENVTLTSLMSHRHVNQPNLSAAKIRTFHTEIITTCHSWNVPFYQLMNTRARGIPLPLKFHRVAQMLLVYGGVKFGMAWTP